MAGKRGKSSLMRKKAIRQFNFDGLTIKSKSFLFHLNRNELRDFHRLTLLPFRFSLAFSFICIYFHRSRSERPPHVPLSPRRRVIFLFHHAIPFFVTVWPAPGPNTERAPCAGERGGRTSANFLDTIRYERCTTK